MHIAYITAGGAGMFCGSCMQDNAIARALMAQDCEVSFIPTYTPIRVDQPSSATAPVFLGGINLYLDTKIPGWRYLPRFFVSWLDHPTVLKWATSRGIENSASELGEMTMAMLDGSHGAMRREYQQLVDYLIALKPDTILFTNALLSGVLPLLREQYSGQIVCLLQGDDLFLDGLPTQFKDAACSKITANCEHFNAFITHSQFYADYMSDYLSLSRDRFQQLPLAIDLPEMPTTVEPSDHQARPVRVGYFARIAPEKGLLNLVEAGCELLQTGADFEIHAGGYLGPAHQTYFDRIQQAAEPLGTRFQYIGSPDTEAEKLTFLQQLDLFCVPVEFVEPKGLYALEAMACRLPVVLPKRGALPELVNQTNSGLVYDPAQSGSLAAALKQLIENPLQREQFAENGHKAVLGSHTTEHSAEKLIAICQQLCTAAASSSQS